MKNVKVSDDLQGFYDHNYDDQMALGREIDAKYKAAHVTQLLSFLSPGEKHLKVLDCGAGEGSVIQFVEKNTVVGEIYGLEISDSAIALARKKSYDKLVEIAKYDGYQIDYPDGFFDVVYCVHVIEHVEHPRLLLRELKRISKYQIYEVPLNYKFYVEKHFSLERSVGHINLYSPALFRFFLMTEGLTIEKYICSQQQLAWYRESEKLQRAGLKRIMINRIKWLVRSILNLPLIRYITDGIGYTSISVLVR